MSQFKAREGSRGERRGLRAVAEPPPVLEERLPARRVAKILGVKVGTLAKWRFLNKGPKGWIRASATLVIYPAREVQRFLEERGNAKGGEQ